MTVTRHRIEQQTHIAMADPQDASSSPLRIPATATSLARVSEPNALSALKLEEQRLIHRNDSARVHADAFRELRTRLLALGGNEPFVTLVASIDHGCGGSFVARNLAAAFAFDESRTALLVDCDAQHPSQARALDVRTDRGGLMDYLEDQAMSLDDAVYGTGIPRLHLMPTGRTREVTAESFTSLRMRTLVDSLRGQDSDQRYVILDGPAVKGSPDARILSDLADQVVLVAGYGRVTQAVIDKAVASFPPEKVAGVVFNYRP